MFGPLSLASAASPVPFVNNPLVPTSVSPGSGAFTLTLNGANLVPGATVYWNGSPRVTTFVSSTQVKASVLASDVATGTTATVVVGNPSTVALSNVSYFAVSRPTAALAKPELFAVADSAQAYTFGSLVAVGDFNGDGKVDLAGSDSVNVYILLGNGDGTFQPPIWYTFGFEPYGIESISVGDVNNDGKPDLIIAGSLQDFSSSALVTVMLGNGDGTFQPQPGINAGAIPSNVAIGAVGDFNGDGNLDIVTINGDNSTNNAAILLGNGDGTFQPYIDVALGTMVPIGLTAGDYNRDGLLDLAVGLPEGYQILTGLGDGSFNVSLQFYLDTYFSRIAAGDINGDGITDLVMASDTFGATVLYGNGDGTFGAPYPTNAPGRLPYGIALGDFNADNKLDMLTGDLDGGGDLFMNVSGFPGNPVGVYSPNALQSANAAVADFNGDGKLDFVLTNSGVYLSTEISISPTALSFDGSVGTPGSKAVTLTNSSQTSTYIGNIEFSGNNAQDFSQTNNCGSKLAAGATCTITVTFVANNDGSFNLTAMSIPENGGRLQSVGLSGTASGSNPVVQLSSKALNWGTQPVGQPSAPASVKLTNIGNKSLTSLGVAVTGANAADFAISSNSCRATEKEDASCIVSIIFTPGATGLRSAALSFTDNAYNSPQTVALTGTGQ
jgi:hypothetical protein